MEGTGDSDIFILNLEVTALKILIKRDYRIICLSPKVVCRKKKRKNIGLLDIYGWYLAKWMLTLTWLRIFIISYKIRNVVEIPSTKWILKYNILKLNALIRKLSVVVACFNHLNFIPW